MMNDFPYQEYDPYESEWGFEDESEWQEYYFHSDSDYLEESVYYLSPNPSIQVGIAAILFGVFVLAGFLPPTELGDVAEVAAVEVAEKSPDVRGNDINPYDVIAPYESYVVTQGPHGASYGHMAVDLAAGKGAAVLSPIQGVVSDIYTDQYGNPTVIIENEIFKVTMLHGDYEVEAGQKVDLGERIGSESNKGYTTDMRGVLCAGRTDYCGYHTHLNIYNKELRKNVHPLSLIQP